MLVGANNETQAQKIIQNCLNLKGPFLIEQLPGGFSGSKIVKVNDLHKAYVVRFWNMQWADYFPQDLACQLIGSDAGYGPKVYFSDAMAGITVMDYLLPETLPEIQIRFQRVVDLLKKIHSGPEVPKGVDRHVYLDLLIDETKASQFYDVAVIKKIKDTVFAATRPQASCVPCHRDLHHGNLIYNQGKFFAIDYTWGAMDDPFADLANVAIFNCETLEEELLLLKLYLERDPTLEEVARLSLMKLPAKIFYGLEFLGIAAAKMMPSVSRVQSSSKHYINFGRHGGPAPSPSDLLGYAATLLGEVVDYSRSECYIMDLEQILESNLLPIY